MPAYNAEKYISEAIESILAQTYTHWELIIVDDGSTDNTVKIIREYQNQDKRIKVYHFDTNKGLPTARNQSIKMANGKYLACLDSDDIAMPERLEKQVDFMEANPEIGVCSTAVKYIGKVKGIWIPPKRHQDIMCLLLFIDSINITSTMILKGIMKNHRFNLDLPIANDFEMWVKITQNTKLINLPEALTKSRKHTNNLTTNNQQLFNDLHKVRTYQLQNYLQISPTEEELRTHHELVKTPEEGFTIEYIKRISKWLNRLAEANQKTRHYPEPEFTDLLTQLWYKNTAGLYHLGLEFGKVFSQSPFSEYKDYSLWQKIKFWAKCLFK
jgi:glycosyltransferase involved in cell wall biosynthesis